MIFDCKEGCAARSTYSMFKYKPKFLYFITDVFTQIRGRFGLGTFRLGTLGCFRHFPQHAVIKVNNICGEPDALFPSKFFFCVTRRTYSSPDVSKINFSFKGCKSSFSYVSENKIIQLNLSFLGIINVYCIDLGTDKSSGWGMAD